VPAYKRAVGMRQLDGQLSKYMKQAHDGQPISVMRRGIPYVWIVAHGTWVGRAGSLRDLVAPDDPLLHLNDTVEQVLHEGGHHVLDAVARDRAWVFPPDELYRALLLQVAFSLGNGQQLYSALQTNLLYRWFIGRNELYAANDLGPQEQFVDEIERLPRYPKVAALVDQVIRSLPGFQGSQPRTFIVNYGLLAAWQR